MIPMPLLDDRSTDDQESADQCTASSGANGSTAISCPRGSTEARAIRGNRVIISLGFTSRDHSSLSVFTEVNLLYPQVEKTIIKTVEKKVPTPVEKIIPVKVEKPVPFHVVKNVPVPVVKPIPIKIPVYKTIVHKVKGH